MTNDEYLLLNQRVEKYRMIRNKINSLKNEKTEGKMISDYLFILLDEDLITKITDVTESVVNEQISRFEKKLEEL